jgi:dolichyl-phosphate beta-glucosyltransferase|tara:strand:+ start:90 stop:821 length:732 start_codon:yes stop_codon:yes gene_type:complete
MIKSLSIIFPLFNEEKRLPNLFKKIKKFSINTKYNIEFIFVDDGSIDKSLIFIKKFKRENIQKIKIKIISYKKNKGKGYALKKGVLSSNKEWILTMDIDLSVSFEQISTWKAKKLIKKKDCSYFGSRLDKNSKIISKKYRVFTGTIFNFILRLLIKDSFLRIKDTQCGFKLYNKYTAKLVFKKIKEYGYVHDVEILIILRKYNLQIYELPIIWVHKGGSKINLISDSIKMFLGLIRLKINYKL